MINGIIIVVLIVVAIFAVKGTMHQFVYGCCGSKDVEKKIKVQDKNTSDYPYYAVVGVDGMKCKHCKLHVENAFNEKDGNWAEVNLEKKEADVRMKTKMTDMCSAILNGSRRRKFFNSECEVSARSD